MTSPKKTRKKPIKHGTEHGYRGRNCRCDECVEAFRSAQRRRRKAAKNKPVPEAVHGTLHGFQYYGCRCAQCWRAYGQHHGPYMKEYRRKNQERLREQRKRYYWEVYKPRLESQEKARRERRLKRGA